MPWKVVPVSQVRVAFVHSVRSLHHSVSSACKVFDISRKTGYKWLKRHDLQPSQPLTDLSRRPVSSPDRTPSSIEQLALEIRDRFGWGPRKIRAFLLNDHPSLPSVRTFANILQRHSRIQSSLTPPPDDLQRFERPAPNQLWQCDFKGPLEIQRRRIAPFSVLDDHSRYLLALRPCTDQKMATAWSILWDLFGDVGLPDALLCDNAFGSPGSSTPGISWFESQLARLNISVSHGRPYHPQTQGKIERFHGTLERELWPIIRRDALDHFDADCQRWRIDVYNSIRPHEALGDKPPLSRWHVSSRKRPSQLPPPEYPAGSVLRKVSKGGEIYWKNYYILAGCGITGQYVRVEERDLEIAVFYASKQIRAIAKSALVRDTFL